MTVIKIITFLNFQFLVCSSLFHVHFTINYQFVYCNCKCVHGEFLCLVHKRFSINFLSFDWSEFLVTCKSITTLHIHVQLSIFAICWSSMIHSPCVNSFIQCLEFCLVLEGKIQSETSFWTQCTMWSEGGTKWVIRQVVC